ncbi:MAG: hypothetical protein BWY15_00381 [Firmicutes bacterium ADurb.Bin193]|nr:MAG: hypothetical protein BWY15_00381 [Firmicutes bacterium ADurb.Bin193]
MIIALFLIIALYLALCLAYFSYHGDEGIRGSFETFNNDDVRYLRSAWTLLETGRYTYRYPDTDTVFVMPGLTTVLAGFVAIFGKYPLVPFKIFQALLGCATLYLIFLCGRKLFKSEVGLVGAGIMALYAPNIYVTGTILTEVCFWFLFLLTFLFSIYALDTHKMRYYIGGGLLLGLCTLFKPCALMFCGVVGVMWLIKRYKFTEALKFALVAGGAAVLVLSPWIVRNALLFGEFIPLTKSSGNPMFQGTFINYDQSVRASENIDYYVIIKEQTDIDIDNYGNNELTDDAAELAMTKIRFDRVIKKEPLKYLWWYTVGKTIQNFREPFLWVVLFGVNIIAYCIQHYLILLLGLAGFFVFLLSRDKNPAAYILMLSVLCFNLMYLPFYCFARYMFPIMFCFALYAGYLIVRLKDMLVARKTA